VDELRRARIGVEGTAPGGFDYVFEIDVAPEVIEIADAYVRYKVSDRIRLTAGQHNNFQSLEELTSSLQTSFIERAAFTDAFNFERRLGVSGTYVDGPLTAQLGIFHENFLDVDETDDAVSLDGRLVYAPRLGTTQLHLAGSAHWRDNGPATATRYRQRPLLHATDVRFVATPSLAVTGETHFGLEAAMIRGPLHLAGEAHWLDPDTAGGSASPTLFGAYLEAGYFLTGETRGYRGARWDRTRVRQGGAIEEGGFGAVQVAVRSDYLDLASGGRQSGLQAALTWIPTDHVRFMLNYARLDYDDAAVPAAGGERDYAVDVVGVRAQLDW
ncbi:MAG TPA: porin, partial [Allosphingosinicella sp.]|nr:porin [Allosphingosinicella sp.]